MTPRLNSIILDGASRHRLRKGFLLLRQRGLSQANDSERLQTIRQVNESLSHEAGLYGFVVEADRHNQAVVTLDTPFLRIYDPSHRNEFFERLKLATSLLIERAHANRLTIVATGVNPYTGSGEQYSLCTDYHQIEVLDDDEVERIYNLYRQFLPELIAFSTNSPLGAGEMQKDFSLRMRFNPTSFLPRYISHYSTSQLERLEYFMRREHGLADLSKMDVNPLQDNALELRFIDAQCSFRFIRAQMLIFQAIAMHGRSLARSGKRLPYMRNRVIGENKALAIQGGLTAVLRPDPGFKDDRGRGGSWFHDRGNTERSSTSILQILDPLLLPYLRDLKCQYWELAPLILGFELRRRGKRCLGNYAEYQKYLFYTSGNSFARMLQERVYQLLSQPQLDWIVEYNQDTFPEIASEVEEAWRGKLQHRERKFGHVRWFGEDKSFGFITQEEESEDIFVHQADLEGANVLFEGQRVSYEVMETDDGPRAVAVRVLPTPRKQGIVRWFDEEKGYGFIDLQEGGDIYVNREDLIETETLIQGQAVSFDAGIVDGKPRALKVEAEQVERKKGQVKWFNDRRGYGFIKQENDEDIYVNREDLTNVKTLFQDQTVTYIVGIVDGKTRAVNVEAEQRERESGQVKWFSEEKGFGFITNDAGDDIFVHKSDLEKVKLLKDKQKVTYEIQESPKGPKAIRVRLAQ